MLYIGEKVGTPRRAGGGHRGRPARGDEPLRHRRPGAIAVMAAAERGGLLHAPDIYMEKLVVPGAARGQVDLLAPVADNLKAIATAMGRDVDDLVVIVLDRPRHEQLIADIRGAGARVQLIGDGDLSAGIRPPSGRPAWTCSWAPAGRPRASSPPRRCGAWTARSRAGSS